MEKSPADSGAFLSPPLALDCWAVDSALLRQRYRSKGIFAIEGTDDTFVFQGVHMMMTMSTSAEGVIKPWGENEKRVNKIVFIGKNLDRDEIKTAFEGCVVKKK